ncbi:acyltransferase family protein [Microbacterium rhizosphaerae]|uniref:Acyltransferase n=1 Tax=Microbacterium rhizosphaerae TaxID=1678237 RepID=A0ABZ0SIN3_9MICO|nr:acyltransferase [Microbacterium rhizosphaerae]WPR88011.1 acyltransferase [Microbacterium rhizosphaerae]
MSTATATIERSERVAPDPGPSAAGSADAPASTDRLAALDGLRGLACLVVLVHHALLTTPIFSAASADPVAARDAANPLELVLTWSPLHIVWEGAGAVWVFFVLSGYVLVRQVREPASFDWVAYYPQRLARLYVPVFAAVALAAVLITIFGNADHGTMASAWMQRRADDVTVKGVLYDGTLLDGAGFTVSPLWSLQWEVWFSLLLPLFVFAVHPHQAARRPIWLALTAPLAAVAIFMLGGAPYLMVFLVGAVLAAAKDPIAAVVDRLTRTRWSAVLLWSACALWVLVMLPARWTLAGIPAVPSSMHVPLSISAAAVVLVMALHCRVATRVLTTRVLLWFGAVSFSLYLVHEPILVALAKIFGDGRLWIALPLGLAIAVAVGAGFWMAVERPATALSRWIGRTVKGRRSAPEPASTR